MCLPAAVLGCGIDVIADSLFLNRFGLGFRRSLLHRLCRCYFRRYDGAVRINSFNWHTPSLT
jgi:hypothetical protein